MTPPLPRADTTEPSAAPDPLPRRIARSPLVPRPRPADRPSALSDPMADHDMLAKVRAALLQL